jgi:hypothetical protein
MAALRTGYSFQVEADHRANSTSLGLTAGLRSRRGSLKPRR